MKRLIHHLSIALITAAAVLLAPVASAQQKVLKFIPQADLRILDPIAPPRTSPATTATWSTTRCSRSTPSSRSSRRWWTSTSCRSDELTYTFTLRDGLKFHDGQPVRSADCIASIERWAQARRARPEARRSDGVLDGRQRQDVHAQAQEAVPARARSARQAVVERAVHHARAHRQDRRVQEHHRADRLRPVQVREGGMGAGQQGGLRQEHRLRAAQGAAVVGRRRQGREGRPRRVDLHPGFGDRRRGAQRRAKPTGGSSCRPT